MREETGRNVSRLEKNANKILVRKPGGPEGKRVFRGSKNKLMDNTKVEEIILKACVTEFICL